MQNTKCDWDEGNDSKKTRRAASRREKKRPRVKEKERQPIWDLHWEAASVSSMELCRELLAVVSGEEEEGVMGPGRPKGLGGTD